jgi:DNA repair protein RecO (recombination protein O)
MSDNRRAQAEQAYVLHSYPYRESSLLLETFTRPYGRVTMIARGARRPRSALRGVLQSFQPLSLAWFGRGEVRTLTRAEWQGGLALLQGEALMCGFYLNELLMRLMPREDPHETLFECYQQALASLSRREASPAVLRGFEKVLMAELGYAMNLDRDGLSGAPLDPDALYSYDPERGPVEIADAQAAADPVLSGRALLAIADDDYCAPETQAQAKALMRMLINHRLDYQPLRSRRIFRELLEM